jgi:hypothetical protein
VATNATLVRIVRFVYDLPEYRVAGGPDWARSQRFDVEARAGRDASADEVKRMVLALLKDRFRLVVRLEQREGPIYALALARNDKKVGPNLQAPVDDKTGLTGLWDAELSYTGERRRNVDAAAVARDPNDAPALFTALQEQLGLRLESGRGPVDVLVIESAAQPAEN